MCNQTKLMIYDNEADKAKSGPCSLVIGNYLNFKIIALVFIWEKLSLISNEPKFSCKFYPLTAY